MVAPPFRRNVSIDLFLFSLRFNKNTSVPFNLHLLYNLKKHMPPTPSKTKILAWKDVIANGKDFPSSSCFSVLFFFFYLGDFEGYACEFTRGFHHQHPKKIAHLLFRQPFLYCRTTLNFAVISVVFSEFASNGDAICQSSPSKVGRYRSLARSHPEPGAQGFLEVDRTRRALFLIWSDDISEHLAKTAWILKI